MKTQHPSQRITLFLCGDVMTGRGIDQILPQPSKPQLFEPYMRSALGYVQLAEEENGPISKPVDFSYIWGDALDAWERLRPDLRIINLETSVTTSEEAQPGKGIHYRMHPDNVPCLTAAGIDCCVLANNHVLDWGYAGLAETLDTLQQAGIATAGAGRNAAEAAAPAVLEVEGKGRVLVFAWGMPGSGVPAEWAAGEKRAGVNFLPDLSLGTIADIAQQVRTVKQAGDQVVASIHWGGNWGFAVSNDYRRFAHSLIDEAGVDVVHGHSSHHVRGIEVYHDRLILYGCGDFLNDYEGISGYDQYRGDLALMYFPVLAQGKLVSLAMTPTQTRRFRVGYAPAEGVQWLKATLNREGERFGTQVTSSEGCELQLSQR
ncbi:CapA family protein [Methylophaga sp. OBS4]|uniref:CapA family protein n=1 Tax=Methylophaga sp. OBS4 TaxID=2991935 RepID=UPI0022504DEC|nr:CapA family protein [Methylophaga sp. OBS4]MCX4186483.1 CapA family protein [Methylophaga sp. OBS4]